MPSSPQVSVWGVWSPVMDTSGPLLSSDWFLKRPFHSTSGFHLSVCIADFPYPLLTSSIRTLDNIVIILNFILMKSPNQCHTQDWFPCLAHLFLVLKFILPLLSFWSFCLPESLGCLCGLHLFMVPGGSWGKIKGSPMAGSSGLTSPQTCLTHPVRMSQLPSQGLHIVIYGASSWCHLVTKFNLGIFIIYSSGIHKYNFYEVFNTLCY